MTKKILLLCFFLYWGTTWLLAQRLSVTGTVTDSITGEPLPYAAVVWEGTYTGAQTDDAGRFSLSFSNAAGSHVLEVSYMGYDTKRIPVRKEAARGLDIRLSPSSIALEEVVIKPGRERYRRRGNPAVEFVRKVIARRDAHVPRDHDYFSYERYQRMIFALNEYTPKPKKDSVINLS